MALPQQLPQTTTSFERRRDFENVLERSIRVLGREAIETREVRGVVEAPAESDLRDGAPLPQRIRELHVFAIDDGPDGADGKPA